MLYNSSYLYLTIKIYILIHTYKLYSCYSVTESKIFNRMNTIINMQYLTNYLIKTNVRISFLSIYHFPVKVLLMLSLQSFFGFLFTLFFLVSYSIVLYAALN